MASEPPDSDLARAHVIRALPERMQRDAIAAALREAREQERAGLRERVEAIARQRIPDAQDPYSALLRWLEDGHVGAHTMRVTLLAILRLLDPASKEQSDAT